MSTLEALLFDVDGTLVDTEELHRQAFNQAFLEARLDWDWTPALYGDLLKVSGGMDRMASWIDRLDVAAAEKMRLRHLIRPIHERKTFMYGRLLASHMVRLRPGVARLVEEARRANLRIGLAATSAAANVHALVETAFGPQARSIIAATVCIAHVRRRKPAPDIYELLLSMLGVAATDCVAVEDSANGLAAAKAAGIFTVVTPTRWTAGQDFAGADLMLPSLGDPQAPLEPAAAARIGGAGWLGLAELEALRSAGSRGPVKLQQVRS